MSKKNEVITAIDTVVTKGDDFLTKAKDFISCVEILLVAATGLKAVLLSLLRCNNIQTIRNLLHCFTIHFTRIIQLSSKEGLDYSPFSQLSWEYLNTPL